MKPVHNSPPVAIIVLNWNGFSDTCECINSLLKDNFSNKSIIIIDNHSSNNEAIKLAKKYQNKITVLKNIQNLGYCDGNNTGVKYAIEHNFKYIMILNNDTIIEPNLINKMTNCLDIESNLAAIGAQIIDYSNPNIVQCRGLTFNLWTGITLTIDTNKNKKSIISRKPDVLSGACFMIRATVIKETKLFDPDYFCYYDDTDLSTKIKKAGYNIDICPSAIVYHKGSISSAKIKGFSEYQLIKNRFMIESKLASFPQKISFLLITIFLYFPFRLLVLIKQKKIRNIPYFLKGFFSGLFNFNKYESASIIKDIKR